MIPLLSSIHKRNIKLQTFKWLKTDQARKDKKILTASHTDEIFPSCFVDFDVAVANVVFVSPQGHVAVRSRLKEHKSLTISSALS